MGTMKGLRVDSGNGCTTLHAHETTRLHTKDGWRGAGEKAQRSRVLLLQRIQAVPGTHVVPHNCSFSFRGLTSSFGLHGDQAHTGCAHTHIGTHTYTNKQGRCGIARLLVQHWEDRDWGIRNSTVHSSLKCMRPVVLIGVCCCTCYNLIFFHV